MAAGYRAVKGKVLREEDLLPVRVGDLLLDMDPRMVGRKVRVVEVHPQYVFAEGLVRVRIRRDRIFGSGGRRSGFCLVHSPGCFESGPEA